MNSEQTTEPAPAVRKPYAPPCLIRYGAVAELTQAGSINANESASNLCPQTDMTRSFNSNCK